MKALALTALSLLLAHAFLHHSHQRTPKQRAAWAKFYGDHKDELADCTDEGMDAPWLQQMSQRRPNRGHPHG